MKKFASIFLFLAFTHLLLGQSLTLRELASLPNVLPESSGIELNDRNTIWSHNDGGNPPALYELDTLGNLLRTITILNTSNDDWEDITQDDEGNIYIGGFGNNSNTRQNLKIYKIPNPATFSGDSIQPDLIYFSYPDQTAFPPPASELHFDMEAMIWLNDSLYLFSKNRTDPFDGFTKIYRLPDKPGTYIAAKGDSFYTGPGPAISYWITAADISPDDKKLVLLSHDKLWLFSCFEGAGFFDGDVQQLALGSFTQKEAVCFINEDELYITDEELVQGFGGKLYYTNLRDFETTPKIDLGNDTVVHATSFLLDAGNPGSSYLWNTGDTTQSITVNTSGSYWVKVTSAAGCQDTDTVDVTLQLTDNIEERPENIRIHIAPNPFTGFAEIKVDLDGDEQGHIAIYDLLGRIVYSGTLGRNHIFQFQPATGQQIYILRLTTREAEYTEYLVQVRD